MKIAILYATTEGQTRKIARFCQGALTAPGRAVELLPLSDAQDFDPATCDGVLLLASVHAGSYQRELEDYVKQARAALARTPHAFLSVSLSAAGDDPEDRAGLATVLANMTKETGWTPQQVEHIAGAFRFSEYNWFKTWAMRWIAAQKDVTVQPGQDIEFTDWDALRAFLDRWSTGLAETRSSPGARASGA